MACHFFCTKPLHEPVMAFYKLDQITIKYELKHNIFVLGKDQ